VEPSAVDPRFLSIYVWSVWFGKLEAVKIVSLATVKDTGVSHNPEIRKRVMLEPGRIPHLTGFAQARFVPGQIAFAHAHDDRAEVFFINDGVGIIRIDGSSYTLVPGICVVAEPGEVHEIENTGQEDLVVTYFGVEN